MLADFVVANRDSIIAAAQARVASRSSPRPSHEEFQNGIPIFLEQLVVALRLAKANEPVAHGDISRSAGRHGKDLFRRGLTIAQVVHDYGDVCQAITTLAVAQSARIFEDEFRMLNLCLDDAIAEAVTEYAHQTQRALKSEQTERLGMLAHELRNVLNTAMLTFDMINSGRVAVAGSTALLHRKSLIALRDLVDRTLTEVRLDAGLKSFEHIKIADLIEEVEIGALLQAQARGVQLAVTPADRSLAVEGDRPLLASVVGNFLQNAFKFTSKGGYVSLSARATAEHVFIDVEDQCGGLPTGKAEELFRPFEQQGTNRSGMGLGLVICQRAAAANAGAVRVRDQPGKGCVFTLELPRAPSPPG
jgi:signal transduction histidine kinase